MGRNGPEPQGNLIVTFTPMSDRLGWTGKVVIPESSRAYRRNTRLSCAL